MPGWSEMFWQLIISPIFRLISSHSRIYLTYTGLYALYQICDAYICRHTCRYEYIRVYMCILYFVRTYLQLSVFSAYPITFVIKCASLLTIQISFCQSSKPFQSFLTSHYYLSLPIFSSATITLINHNAHACLHSM